MQLILHDTCAEFTILFNPVQLVKEGFLILRHGSFKVVRHFQRNMVFKKFMEFVSSVANSVRQPKISTLPHKSHGLPRNPGSLHGYTYSSFEKTNNFKPSSSLQDLSSYRELDLEEGSASAYPQNLLQNETGASSFSKEKVPPVNLSRRKKWKQIIFILLCLFLFASLSFGLHFMYSNWSEGLSKYYVVLDCGSTGTRVYVYQASINHNGNDSFPIMLKSLPEDFHMKPGSRKGRAYNRVETEPGFDKLVHNKSGLEKSLKPLIKWAEKQIPKRLHKSTSLFLYATAGVRRLPNSDSEWLLNNAWSYLKRSPFLCKKEWVKTITGMEEAYFGWIALNYHTGVFGSIPRKETYGALDLGGSSLQVTFEGQQHWHDKTSLNISIGHEKHHLNAYSLSGYGLNDAFDKSVAHLLNRLPQKSNADLITGKVKIKHPCLQFGYKEKYTCSNCVSVPLEDGNSPSRGKKMGKGAKAGVTVQLIGAPKWEECSALARNVVNLSEWSNQNSGIDCELQPCALAENIPRPVGQFYIMSGFYVVFRFFGLSHDSALDDVLEKGREFCEKNWDVARESVVPQPFIEQYCFRAPYIVLLLREGLHITDRDVIVGSGSITWTIGVALFEAGKALPIGGKSLSYEILLGKVNPFILCAAIIALLFILLCALSCTGRLPVLKFFRRPFLPFFRHSSVASASVLNIPAPFRFKRWSPINAGDGRVKLPLSPTVASARKGPFDTGFGFGGGGVGIEFTDSSLYSSSSSFSHSYSSGSLGQMQVDNNTLGSFWTPHGGQMRLQSRRSQSREDLINAIVGTHLTKI